MNNWQRIIWIDKIVRKIKSGKAYCRKINISKNEVPKDILRKFIKSDYEEDIEKEDNKLFYHWIGFISWVALFIYRDYVFELFSELFEVWGFK